MYRQAVILAGGKGTRLLPLTLHVPKPMVTVANKPFLYWQLTYLQKQGVRDVLLLVSHLADVIRSHFSNHPIPGLNIEYSVEPSPLGTGGALKHALPFLQEKFWLLNGDSFLFIELAKMAHELNANSWQACLATIEQHLVGVPGNVELEGTLVAKYKRDAGFKHIDAGVYLLERSVVENGPGGIFDLGNYWQRLAPTGKVGAFTTTERFFDIGTPERLQFFAQHLRDYF